jgi:hypothetical protein
MRAHAHEAAITLSKSASLAGKCIKAAWHSSAPVGQRFIHPPEAGLASTARQPQFGERQPARLILRRPAVSIA